MSIFDSLRQASRQIELEQKREAYKSDIRLWAKERLGFHLWNKQVEIANALLKHRRVAVKSGHGVGKTFVSSVILSWFVETHKDVEALAVTTAPTQPQLDLIWEEARKHHFKANMFGRISLENEWRGDDKTKRAYGRKPSDTNPHAFQGEHRKSGVLAIIDEGCGVPEQIFTAIDAITTGMYDYCLAVGNPDDSETPFGRIWSTDDPSWHKITINSLDSPNITGEDFPEDARGGLVTLEWIESRKRAWGEDSPRYRSKVLGEFTFGGNNNLFIPRTLAKGVETEITPLTEAKPVLGVDVARYGVDYTVVYINYNGKVRKLASWSKADLVDTSERVVRLAIAHGVSEVRIDGVGIGAGVWDMVARMSENRWKTIGLLGNNRSPDLDMWANYRAYAYDTFRARMERGEIDIEFEDRALYEELEGIAYKFNSRGAIQIESKDEMIKRGMKSPDFADAAMYAVAPLLVDPQDPLSTFSENDEISLALEDMLAEEEIRIL